MVEDIGETTVVEECVSLDFEKLEELCTMFISVIDKHLTRYLDLTEASNKLSQEVHSKVFENVLSLLNAMPGLSNFHNLAVQHNQGVTAMPLDDMLPGWHKGLCKCGMLLVFRSEQEEVMCAGCFALYDIVDGALGRRVWGV